MTSSAWDQRIARAESLALAHPASAGLLKFYAEIARFQKGVHHSLEVRRELNADLLTPHFAPLLALVQRIGPEPLARAAGELTGRIPNLSDLSGDEIHAFFTRALLQPYTECLARRSLIQIGGSPPTCPFCGEKPQVGVLREAGDGARRSLICSLCATEWEYRRLVCPGCGEEEVDKLAVYTASEFEHVRIEACESCKTYIKSVDLTRNGLAIPVVDELASLPLTVWAEENGYRKLQLNLLGM